MVINKPMFFFLYDVCIKQIQKTPEGFLCRKAVMNFREVICRSKIILNLFLHHSTLTPVSSFGFHNKYAAASFFNTFFK